MNAEKKQYIHPMTGAIREITDIFSEMGFVVADGPELEEEHYNFDALNVKKDHPSRDMQDTFWLPDGRVMRTQDTATSARYMEKHEPPMRFVSCGKVYRNEATDMTHEAQFYQVDAFAIDKDITLAHLKGTLETFLSKFVGGEVETRFRPGYFPFVEPGVEVDMRLIGDDAPEKLKGKWIEILGAGMLHPEVLKAGGINPEEYQGWAFGSGIDRLAMLKWAIEDVRHFYNGDLRFVQQFESEK